MVGGWWLNIGGRGAVADMEEGGGRGGGPLLSRLHDSQVEQKFLGLDVFIYLRTVSLSE